MEKYYLINDEDVRVIDTENIKVAESSDLTPELQRAVAELKPDKNFAYLIIVAITAGEYWGANRNNDYTRAEDLKKHHGTFVTNSKIFKHHKNKPSDPSFGHIVFSCYNSKMERVELLIAVDRRLAPEITDKIDTGQLTSWSMGMKIPGDVCSLCGNFAKNRSQYCNCLKSKPGAFDSNTGKKVYAINQPPITFIDLSYVRVNADRTAFGMRKVASAPDKEAVIKKEEVIKAVGGRTPEEALFRHSQRSMSMDLIKKVSSYPFEDILSSFLALKLMPTLTDFQNLYLYSRGKERLANNLSAEGLVCERGYNPNTYLIFGTPNEELLDFLLTQNIRAIVSKPVVTSRILHMKVNPSFEYDSEKSAKYEGSEEVYTLYNSFLDRFNKSEPFTKKAGKLFHNGYSPYESLRVPRSYLFPSTPPIWETTIRIEKEVPSFESILAQILGLGTEHLDSLYNKIILY